MSETEILADYEDLEHNDLLATYQWAARLSRVKRAGLREVERCLSEGI